MSARDGRWAASTDWGSHDIDVFLTDRTTGTRTQIDGTAFRDSPYDPTISADGRLVAYQDDGTGDVWVADRVVADATAAASAIAGAVGDGGVAFSSAATDLVPDDTNGIADVFVRR